MQGGGLKAQLVCLRAGDCSGKVHTLGQLQDPTTKAEHQIEFGLTDFSDPEPDLHLSGTQSQVSLVLKHFS